MPNYYAYRMAQALFGLSIAYEKSFLKMKVELPGPGEVINSLKWLEYDSPSGKVVMALANGHQAIQETAVGTVVFDSNGDYKVEDKE